MSNGYYMAKYKNKVRSYLITSDNIIKLINPVVAENLNVEDVLLGGVFQVIDTDTGKTIKVKEQGHIFDYLFVDETTHESKVFICIESVIDSVAYPFLNMILYIYVYVHRDLMRLTSETSPKSSEMYKAGFYGNRADQLTDAIDRMLNGNQTFGIGEVSPADRGYISVSVPNSSFYGKCMRYKVRVSNEELNNCENY